MYYVDIGLGMKKGLITIKKAAELLQVNSQTLKRWDKSGKLKAVRHPMNNYRLYKKADLLKLLKEFEKL
jgi:excisionase family DNA binding protein